MIGRSPAHALPGQDGRAEARGPWFRVKLVGAFAAIYLIWGSNFLAIRYAVETIPPFFLMGVRSLLAGALLLAWARSRGAPRPAAVHWRAATVAGALLFLGCHGTLAWAEQRVPSGLAALMLATIAVWLPLIDWLAGGRRPSATVWSGLAVAVAGVALLTSPGLPAYREVDGTGAVVLLASAFFWAAGSIVSRRLARPSSAVLTTGMQLVAGGVLLCLVAAPAGETAAVMAGGVSARSLWGFAYMVGLASIVGFTAYTWLLRVASPSAVGTYALVLPIVALVVGWALAGEAITSRTIVAATLTIAGVALIMSAPAAGGVGARAAAALRPAGGRGPGPSRSADDRAGGESPDPITDTRSPRPIAPSPFPGVIPMIVRTWRGATSTADAAAYAGYVERTGLAAYRGTPGNLGALILQRAIADRTEILVVSFWHSLEAIQAFAGNAIEDAVFYPEDDRYLVERDLTVHHYEVAAVDLDPAAIRRGADGGIGTAGAEGREV